MTQFRIAPACRAERGAGRNCACLPPQRGRRELRIGSAAIFAVALVVGFLVTPLAADAQQPGRVYRIGFLAAGTYAPSETNAQHCPIRGSLFWQALVAGLREHGYIQSQNLVIECRFTEGREERAPALAAELVSLKPDLLVPVGTTQTRAAKQATSAIPIVMVGIWNPVEGGLIASLAHPGGNVTGLADTAGVGVEEKHLQFLKEAVPKVSRVAVLYYAPNPAEPLVWHTLPEAAKPLNVTFQPYAVQDPKEFAGAFAAMTKARAEALLVRSHPVINTHTRRIVELAAQSRLPAVYPYREAAAAGGLMGYGVNLADNFRRVGFYVDKIFKGAKPGDLPVEQPTKFELVINMRTAKALGLTIPPSLLMRADQVIE
jgi:putative tryptophan/tyrosine transport system substrate-binding protein